MRNRSSKDLRPDNTRQAVYDGDMRRLSASEPIGRAVFDTSSETDDRSIRIHRLLRVLKKEPLLLRRKGICGSVYGVQHQVGVHHSLAAVRLSKNLQQPCTSLPVCEMAISRN